MDLLKRIILGSTGLSVGRLGIAASYGVSAQAIEHAYHDFNINYFYWGSMRRRGMRDAIRNLAPGHRDDLVIALQSYDRTGLIMRRSLERGLRSLRIDIADILILGWYNRRPSRRIMEMAFDLRERGLVRFIALSGHHRPLFGELAGEPGGSPFDIFMIRYNAAHRGAETDIFPHLSEDIRPGITCYTATSWGHLLNPRRMPPDESPLSAAECYRFVLSNPRVDLCMTGPRDGNQLSHGLTALKRGPLTPEEMVRIRKIGDHVRLGRRFL